MTLEKEKAAEKKIHKRKTGEKMKQPQRSVDLTC